MGKLKDFLSENRKLSYTMFFAWLSACVFAIYYGAVTNGSEFDGICEYVKKIIESKTGIAEITKNGIITNLRFLFFILIISMTAFLCPGAAVLSAFKGFACGMTSVILIRLYGIRAMAAVFFAVVIPQLVSMPIYMTMLVSSVKYPLGRIKADKVETAASKRKQWLSFAFVQLILTGVLSCISVAESLILQVIYPILNQ